MSGWHSDEDAGDISVSALLPLVDALEDIGADTVAMLHRHGLSRPWVEEGRGSVSRACFAAFAGDALATLHVHTARRSGLSPFLLRSFRLMCRAMLSCANLREAASVAVEFADVTGGQCAGGGVIAERGEVFFRVAPSARDASHAAFLVSIFGVAVMHRLLGWLIGEEIPLKEINLAFPPRANQVLMASLFDGEPVFDARNTGFRFDARLLDRPVVRTGADLDQLFRLFPFDLFPPDYRAAGVSGQVRSLVRSAMGRGEALPGLDDVAGLYGVSVSTIRRWLAEEGHSLNSLQRDLKVEIATSLLADHRFRIADVAVRVGYHDTTTFRRAFHDWTGMSPAEWRRSHRCEGRDTAGHARDLG